MARRKRSSPRPYRPPDAQFESIEDLELRGLPAPIVRSGCSNIRDMARPTPKRRCCSGAKYARDTSLPVLVRKACYDELMNRGFGRPRDEESRGFDGVIEVRFVKGRAEPGASHRRSFLKRSRKRSRIGRSY